MLRFVSMFTKKIHGILAILMMAFLLSAKLMAFHSISHIEDTAETCSICEHAILTQITPAMESEPGADIPVPALPPNDREPVVFHEIHFNSGQLDTSLFSRPPPVA